MIRNRLLLNAVRLQMFADGGGGDGGSATASTDTGTATTQAENKSGLANRTSGRRNKGELTNVIYGKTEEPAGSEEVNNNNLDAEGKHEPDVTTSSNTLEERKKAFEDLINGEYKDLFTERTQAIIDRRFRETKNLESQVNEAKPILDILMSKYKIADGDISKLAKAIETDDTYWEEAAEEAGLSVEQYRLVQQLERENAELRRMQRQAEGQRNMDNQLNEWYRQGEELKKIYPEFDFKKECQNKEFLGLLKANIPVKHAYETLHLSELITGAASVAAQQAEQRTVSNIRSRASRPAENGTSSRSTATIKSDVSSFTRADREEIARRVARGERIVL